MRYFEKTAKDSNSILPYTAIPATMLGIGALAGTLAPGLRGKHGKLLGSLAATKKIFFDAPLSAITGKKFLDRNIFNTDKVHLLKISPQAIIDKSISKAPAELTSIYEKYNATKGLHFKSSLEVLKEQEAIARSEKATKIVGASHFTPTQAAMMGYSISDAVRPNVIRHFASNKIYGWYPALRRNAMKKINAEGIKSLNANDVYPLVADTKTLRLYEKDLTIPNEQAVQVAKQKLKTLSKEELALANENEKTFTKKYSDFIDLIMKGK